MYIAFPLTEQLLKTKQNKQAKNGTANMAPENIVLKPELSYISDSIFNWYLWSIQLAIDQKIFLFFILRI